MASTHIFPFDGLPAELRNRIFKYCMHNHNTALLHTRLSTSGERNEIEVLSKPTWARVPSIAKTNHQFHNEFLYELRHYEPDHEIELNSNQLGEGVRSMSTTPMRQFASLTIRLQDVRLECTRKRKWTPESRQRAEANIMHATKTITELAEHFKFIEKLKVVVCYVADNRNGRDWHLEMLRNALFSHIGHFFKEYRMVELSVWKAGKPYGWRRIIENGEMKTDFIL